MRYWLLPRLSTWLDHAARRNTPTNTRVNNTGRSRWMRNWLSASLLIFMMPRKRIVWKLVKLALVSVLYSGTPSSDRRGRTSEVQDGHGANA